MQERRFGYEEEWGRLMRLALDGDALAYRTLLGAIAPHLRNTVRRFLARSGRGTADLEDIVQEILLAVHLKRATWDRSLPFMPWLNAVARYKTIDALRRAGIRGEVELDGLADTLAAQGMLPGPMTALRLDRLRNPQAIRASLRRDNTEPDDLLMTVLSDVSRDEVLHCPHVAAFRFERAVLPRRQIRPPLPDPLPIVSIIIPTRDGWDLLGPCLESLGRTDWSVAQREIIVVDNGSSDPSCLAGLARAEAAGSVRVLRDPRPFNFAALNNRAVSLAKGDLLVFLNNDTLALRPDWLRVLSAFAWLPGAGAVGPKLLYADGSVQHAGLVFGLNGRAVHVHVGLPSDAGGYQGLASVSHEVSGVTGACLALRRAAFEAVGGFDEGFPVAYNDMILCADLMKKGYRNLYVAEPLFLHLESRTRGNLDNPEKQRREADEAARARALHPDLFAADPHYSPNLSLDAPYVPAVPPRRRPPWHMAASQLHPTD